MIKNYLYQSDELSRIDQIYQNCLQLRQSQINSINAEIIKLEEMIQNQLNAIKNFFQQFENLIPSDQKILKKAKKFQWIKIYFQTPSILMYQFDEDLLTYSIYYKLDLIIKKEEIRLQKWLNNEFVSQISYEFINQVNEKFCHLLKQNHQQIISQNQLNLNEKINFVMTADDILNAEEFSRIVSFLRGIPQNYVQNQIKNIIDIQLSTYKNYYNPQIMRQNHYQKVILNIVDYAAKSPNFNKNLLNIKFNNYNELQIINKEPGIYVYSKEKSVLIFKVSKNQKIIIFMVNKFGHYKEIKEKLNQFQNFPIYKFRMINMKLKEVYLVARFIYKTKIKNNQFIDEIFEFHSNSQVQQVEEFYRIQYEKQEQIQNSIISLIKQFIPSCNNHNDIYSEQFVEILMQKSQSEFNLLPINQLNKINCDSFKESQGLILIDNNNLLLGAIIIQQNKALFFIAKKQDQLNILQKNFQQISQLNILQTNVQKINIKVARFYVSLILFKAQVNDLQLIKMFLEQQKSAQEHILQLIKGINFFEQKSF